jgi:hypothetical protein
MCPCYLRPSRLETVTRGLAKPLTSFNTKRGLRVFSAVVDIFQRQEGPEYCNCSTAETDIGGSSKIV